MEALRKVLAEDSRIAYALVFGSTARGTAHASSDLDVAVGLEPSVRLGAIELGNLISSILEYLDFRPIETLASRGVLAAAAHGR